MLRLLLLISSLLLAAFHVSDAFLVSVAEEQDVEVIANPHDTRDKGACQAGGGGVLLNKLLEPYQLIVTPMVTQADTLQELSYAKVLTVPVPVYKMKQPARISAAELEFQMVLVKDLGVTSGIQEVPYPMEQALDSWFLGYYWSPLIMSCGNDNWQHVGWKFTAVPAANHSILESNHNKLPHFFALVVQLDQKKATESVRIGGFEAPGWMVGAVLTA